MSRPDDIDEKKQQQWQARVAQERLELSASVEEALVDASANEDVDADELENDVSLLKSGKLIPPRLSLQSKPLPAVRTAVKVQNNYLPMTKAGKAVSSSLASFSPVPGKRRSTIRTTKVHLQVVPKPEASESAGMGSVPGITPIEVTTNTGMPAQEKREVPREALSSDVNREVSGEDRFEKGQSERMVANTHITATSVVIVVLTADPGPVVVQYVTLHPKVGFTVHLSAATKKATSFNYRIC